MAVRPARLLLLVPCTSQPLPGTQRTPTCQTRLRSSVSHQTGPARRRWIKLQNTLQDGSCFLKPFHRGKSNRIDPGGISPAQSCGFPRTRIHLRSTAAPGGFKGNVARPQHGTPRPRSHLPFPGPSYPQGFPPAPFLLFHTAQLLFGQGERCLHFINFIYPNPTSSSVPATTTPPAIRQNGLRRGKSQPTQPQLCGAAFHPPPAPRPWGMLRAAGTLAALPGLPSRSPFTAARDSPAPGSMHRVGKRKIPDPSSSGEEGLDAPGVLHPGSEQGFGDGGDGSFVPWV